MSAMRLVGFFSCVMTCLALTACGRGPHRSVHVSVGSLDPAALRWSGRPVTSAAIRGDEVWLEVPLDAPSRDAALVLEHPEACPAEVAITRGAEPIVAELRELFTVPTDLPQLGFGQPFSIQARPHCREAMLARVEWTAEGVDGPIAVEMNGYRVRGRTKPLDESVRIPPFGIVPLSPRTRSLATLRATLTLPGRAPFVRTVHVSAMPRASGLPSLPLGGAVLLAGGPFEVRESAPEARSRPSPLDERGLSIFVPDTDGRWTLVNDRGQELSLRVGRHDDAPLDCGRPECHANAGQHAVDSAMTHAFFRQYTVEGLGVAASCTIGCHTTGENGLHDGGYRDIATWLGYDDHRLVDGWERMPRELRRFAGVGCSACHGPAEIPEPMARWAVLRVDVCAVCHDAPPRYGHVAAWRTQAMSRSDADPRTHTGACATCHTTDGFLDMLGARENVSPPPSDQRPIGITCQACHSVHDEQRRLDGLVRRFPRPAALEAAGHPGQSSEVCWSCHAPREGEALPSATTAALVLGLGARSVTDVAAPHAGLEETCVGCHRGGPAELERGRGHAFGVDAQACVSCHADGAPRDPSIAERARRLAASLDLSSEHVDGGTELDALRYDLALVLRDPAPDAHGGRFARAILDRVEASLARAPAPPGP